MADNFEKLVNASDLIEWIMEAYPDWCVGDVRGIVDHIDNMSSAQPEIVKCRDCRWGREVCGNIECFADINVPIEYHGYDWFCPNGERRTDGSDR